VIDKNSAINYIASHKTNIAILCLLGMLAGFMSSRALLSGAMFSFGVNALWNVHPRQWLQKKWWLMGVAWVGMYALSFFWSEDKISWSQHIQVKMPVLLLPLAFAFLPSFSNKQLKYFTNISAAMLLAGTAYSLCFLVIDPAYYIDQYHFSHVLPTPPENDHIRFSLCISLFFMWCAYIFPKLSDKFSRWFVGTSMVIFALYLHLLAARSGLVTWYLFILLWAAYISIKKNKLFGIFILIATCLFAITAITFIPTLNKRIAYIKYSFEMFQKRDLTGQYSDIGRLISYDISAKLIEKNALLGVGCGDIMAEMKDGYQQYYPEVEEVRQLIPHNQFLIVATGTGIIGLIFFVLWMFYPLKWIGLKREKYFFAITWLSLLIPILFEPMLEIQFGLFVFLFFYLLQMHQIGVEHSNKQYK
jgi:Lipid A core - O-antigen ligase and related enzymes